MKKFKLRQTLIKYLFVLLIVVVVSCEKKKTAATYLTGGSQKYWTMIHMHPIKTSRGTLFNINGTYEVFFKNEKSVRVRIDLNSSGKWKLIGDSILFMGQDIKLRVEYINDEIIVMNNLNMRELVVYKVANDQKSPLAVDTVDHSKEL